MGATMAKKKTGRPLKKIDPEQIEKLAMLHCTNVEIAALFGVDEKTIRGRFSDIIAKGKAAGKMSLRRMQWKAAEGGNVTMQIFLGKNMLNQTNNETVTHDGSVEVKISYVNNGKGNG